jgi:predicted nuclease of predicted toxin-antitoxin system
MNFIVDESTGMAVVQYLRDAGYDVLAVSEVLPQADDATILATAVAENRILITNDKDFGDLVFRSGQSHHGIILLRLRDNSAGTRVRVLAALLNQYAARLPGNLTIATETSVRIRPVQSP